MIRSTSTLTLFICCFAFSIYFLNVNGLIINNLAIASNPQLSMLKLSPSVKVWNDKVYMIYSSANNYTRVLVETQLSNAGTIVGTFGSAKNYSGESVDFLDLGTNLLIRLDGELYGYGSTQGLVFLGKSDTIPLLVGTKGVFYGSPTTPSVNGTLVNATVMVTDGTLAGTAVGFTKSYWVFDVTRPNLCAPKFIVSRGSDFLFMDSTCTQTALGMDNKLYVANTTTYFTNQNIIGYTNVLGFMGSDGRPLAVMNIPDYSRPVLIGADGKIANLTHPVNESTLTSNFQFFMGSVYFLGKGNRDNSTGYNTHIYKVSAPYTNIQIWNNNGSYLWISLSVIKTELWAVSGESVQYDLVPKPMLLSINSNTINDVTLKATLYSDVFHGPAGPSSISWQLFSGGVSSQKLNVGGQSSTGIAKYYSMDGNMTTYATSSTSPGGSFGGYSLIYADYNGVWIYKNTGFPHMIVPCGDGIQQYPELCDDGNNMNGDVCNMYCNVSTAITSASITSGVGVISTNSVTSGENANTSTITNTNDVTTSVSEVSYGYSLHSNNWIPCIVISFILFIRI